MNLVKIMGHYTASDTNQKTDFHITRMTWKDVKETKDSYMWPNHRLSKKKLNVIDSVTNNNDLTYQFYYMWVKDDVDSIESGTKQVEAHMRKIIAFKISEFEKYNDLARKALESVCEIKDEEREVW